MNKRRRSCAIANVGIQGINPLELARLLLEKHTLAELDTFVRALEALAAS